MKSYLRFLSRNKLYTAIEVVGLSIALAFVIILSSYIADDICTDKDVRDKSRILVCHNTGELYSDKKLHIAFDDVPEIESYCMFTDRSIVLSIKKGENFHVKEPLYVSSNFFEFMGYKLTAGDASEVLKEKGDVVISEALAKELFPDEDPVGQVLKYVDKDEDSKPFWNTMTIKGIFKVPKKSMILNRDMVMNIQDWRGYNDSVLNSYANLIKIQDDCDLASVCDKIYESAVNHGIECYKNKLFASVSLTAFNRIDINTGSPEESPFINLPDRKMGRTFAATCAILLIFAILNYISLTMAFSRFRNKETATRRLLGTSRVSLTFRSFMESFMLTAAAFIMGATLAWIIQEEVSGLLAKEIKIFSTSAEIYWGAFLIIFLSILSSLVPAYSTSLTKPIDVIKGEARYHDKSILGKIFISIQAGLSVACISIALSIWLQTKKMIDTPLGYRTENIVMIDGSFMEDVYSELSSLPCITRLGRISTVPVSTETGVRSVRIGNEMVRIRNFSCDTAALSILDIEILERYKNTFNNFDLLVTESSAEQIRNYCSSNDISHDRIKDAIGGITTDFKCGNYRISDENLIGISIFSSDWMRTYLAEVTGGPNDAIEQIRMRLEGLASEVPPEEKFDIELQISTLQDLVRDSYSKEKDSLSLIGIFSLLCIMLTAMAMIALSSQHAQLRRHDTAINKIFGISHKEIFWRTVWSYCIPVILGAIVAIPIAYLYIERWLQAYAVKIVNSPLIYAAALSMVMAVTVVSVSMQALQLMRTNPAEALKKE